MYEYPANPQWDRSGRILGTAKNAVSLLAWDQMNSRLGPTKKVNVILAGFGDQGPEIAQWQEAKWIGGKKNDVVICFGGPAEHPTWVYVFGWTEESICKRTVESIVLSGGAVTTNIPFIEKEIQSNYKLKDWSKFDYLTVEPPGWSYILLIVLVVGVTVFIYITFSTNMEDKRTIDRWSRNSDLRW